MKDRGLLIVGYKDHFNALTIDCEEFGTLLGKSVAIIYVRDSQ